MCVHELNMHMACIHTYYKKNHKNSTFQCTEHQTLRNIITSNLFWEKCYSGLQLCYNPNLQNLEEKKLVSYALRNYDFITGKQNQHLAYVKSKHRQKGMVAFVQIRHRSP